jgi:hypothetical protein
VPARDDTRVRAAASSAQQPPHCWIVGYVSGMNHSMSSPAQSGTDMRAACVCGRVELVLIGNPIVTSICYCEDCQAGARQLAALPGAPLLAGDDGGTAYVLFPKDRVQGMTGNSLLKAYKLKEKSVTNRVVATCCNAPMLMNFDNVRHWVPIYRTRVLGNPPPIEMRICTKFKPDNVNLSDGIPSYPSYPPKFLVRLLAAWVSMLFRR